MRNKIIILLIFSVTVAAGVSSYIGSGWTARAIENGPFITEINAEAIAFNREDPTARKAGALTYVGGWALTSESPDFGGWSALVLGDGAKSITVLNDKGDWLEVGILLKKAQGLQLKWIMTPKACCGWAPGFSWGLSKTTAFLRLTRLAGRTDWRDIISWLT